ncbi:MAG: hypothetical protein ACI84C_002700, partial [Flavobacteriales bacterium]
VQKTNSNEKMTCRIYVEEPKILKCLGSII